MAWEQLTKDPIPSTPLHCTEECFPKYYPTCYTNYKPHFHGQYYLTDIMVGQDKSHGWELEEPDFKAEMETFGYINNRPLFMVREEGSCVVR